jgi:hypothetical protein
MKNIIFSILALFFASTSILNGQTCPTTLQTGQNLVANPDFSQGYTGWTHDAGYTEFVSGNSNPGIIYAGSSAHFFNPGGFTDYDDHTPAPNNDNMMLMVDGLCTVGVKLWSQSNIPITPNTRYYFSVWISSLKNNPTDQGHLRFDINGTDLATAVNAPIAGQTWVQFETFWDSGPTPPATATISIENTTTTGCATEVDFAIDDINFIPGCSFADAGAQPSLGGNTTICGKGGSITLDAGIPVGLRTATTQVYWSDGVGGGTGTNPAFYSKTITTPGTYSVCVKQGSSCLKSDVVVISGTFSVDLGPDVVLCSPASKTLDAVFTGPGVKYKWYKSYPTRAGGNDSSQTFFVNTSGTYRVEVIDPICGTQWDEVIITSNAPVPTNATFCSPSTVNLSVSPVNSGKYKWWKTSTGTTPADLLQKGGASYSFAASGTTNYTYYAEDTSSFRTTIGPPLTNTGVYTGFGQRGVQNESKFVFDVLMPITIDSVYMYVIVYGCTTPIGFNIVNSTGTVIPGGAVNYSYTSAAGCVSGGTWQWVKVPANVSVPAGTGYRIEYAEPAGNNTDMSWYNAGMTWGTTYASAVKFVSPFTGQPANSVPGMWRWVITAGSGCARVPVVANYSCPLPIKLIDFSAVELGEGVSLNWSTETETNNGHFVIQRSSDGIHFSDINTIEGAGNSNAIINYNYIDYPESYSILYYRLKQVDLNGEYSFTKMVNVKKGLSNTSIYPSPLSQGESLNIKIGRESEKIKMVIIDVLGRKVLEQSFTNINHNGTVVTDPLSLEKGLYIVEISTDNQAASSERIIIQ